jgi:hypothetical protein
LALRVGHTLSDGRSAELEDDGDLTAARERRGSKASAQSDERRIEVLESRLLRLGYRTVCAYREARDECRCCCEDRKKSAARMLAGGWTSMSHLSLPFQLVRALTAVPPPLKRSHPMQECGPLQSLDRFVT